jgi:hypothetical protein
MKTYYSIALFLSFPMLIASCEYKLDFECQQSYQANDIDTEVNIVVVGIDGKPLPNKKLVFNNYFVEKLSATTDNMGKASVRFKWRDPDCGPSTWQITTQEESTFKPINCVAAPWYSLPPKVRTATISDTIYMDSIKTTLIRIKANRTSAYDIEFSVFKNGVWFGSYNSKPNSSQTLQVWTRDILMRQFYPDTVFRNQIPNSERIIRVQTYAKIGFNINVIVPPSSKYIAIKDFEKRDTILINF